MTGLNCNKPPKTKTRKSKRKLLPGKYWYSLFDRADVSVEWVVSRLKKRLVPDKDIRLRYAMLALIDGVLCPTSDKPKISPIHADMSENIENFINHPWGTTSFQLTLKSIKARGPDKLKRKSVTVQGFPYALQLLLLHSVPVIRELQFPDPDLDTDGDSKMEEIDTEIERLWTLKLDLVWKVDKKPTVSYSYIVIYFFCPLQPIYSPWFLYSPIVTSCYLFKLSLYACYLYDNHAFCIENMISLLYSVFLYNDAS